LLQLWYPVQWIPIAIRRPASEERERFEIDRFKFFILKSKEEMGLILQS